MTLASFLRTRVPRALAALLVLGGSLVFIAPDESARADGTPNVQLSKSMPGEALAGDPAIPVTLTATNLSGTDGFNLTFVDVLPAGVSFVSSSPAPSQTISNHPATGQTTLVWENVSDLQAGVTQSLTYVISAGTLPVGSSISVVGDEAKASVNSNPRVVPTYDTVSEQIIDDTGYDATSDSTLLVPFILEKIEPGDEAELLRGIHDHQATYTLEIRNNYLGPTTNFDIQDWLPAGMEFLGCGGVDNSSAAEYTGSGPINPGNEPPMANPCVFPTTVATVETDPPGPLPFGIYTHVVWDVATLNTSLNAAGVVRFDYVAAIPSNANALWTGTAPDPATGLQASNLDNNTGDSTEETGVEIDMTNSAVARGVYSGTTYSDQAEMSVSSEDLSIHKTAGHGTIAHGATTTWTLTVETSEYVGTATDLVVTDSVPDGLEPSGGSYDTAVANPDGTWTVTWNLADMGRSELAELTFTTTTLTHYQENGANDTPVLAKDSWTNSVSIVGTVDGRGVADVSSDDQSAAPVAIVKEVAERVDPFTTCGDGSGLTWNATFAGNYRIGDQVCWRLGVDFPVDLDTFDSDINDYLPPGHEFTGADSWGYGANNTVPSGDVAGPGVVTPGDPLTWTVGDGGGYVAEDRYLEVVFSSTIVDPAATSSGSLVANLMKYSYTNTAGTPFNLRDQADIEVLEAELDLVKGVAAVEGTSTGGSNVDGVSVMEADIVTYQLTISNDGDIPANDVEVWDELPAEYDACAATVDAISHGGSCANATRIAWSGLTVPANDTLTLTYDVTFPTDIAPNETIPNRAGVRTYTSDTNNGAGTFAYFPAANIDTTVVPNTTAAHDNSSVVTADVAIAKSATTSVDEGGNNAGGQATIGEVVTYTIDVTIPEGTTVDEATLVDDLPINLDLISATATFDGVGGDGAVTVASDGAADSVTVTLNDTNYANPPGSGDDTLTVTITARVLDVPQNSHGVSISNDAAFSWTNGAGGTRTDSADVTVVEPRVGISKTSIDGFGNDGIVVGGETVDYDVVVRNFAAAATAHDLVVVDTLPVGVTPVLASITAGGSWDSGPRTITWSVASLAPGATTTLEYQVTVDDPVIVSTSITNNVVVDATSLEEPSTGERSAGSRYTATASDTQNTPVGTIAKTVNPATATIGEVVTYTVDITIPPGTIMYDATVIDTLPSQLIYDGMVGASVCDMNGSTCDPMITATDIGVIGSQAVGFWLGDIVPASATGEARVVSIEYEAHLNTSAERGMTPTNSATLYGNRSDKIVVDPSVPPPAAGFDVSDGPATASITVVEPHLTIDKDVSGQVDDTDQRRALPGDTLTYTVVVRNTGASYLSAAHDLTVVDTLTDLSYLTVSAVSNGGVWDSATDTITWTVTGPLAPGAAATFTYDVTIDGDIGTAEENAAGYEMVNTADVPSYFGVSNADRTANPDPDYNEYDDVDDDVVNVELDLASIGDYLWFDIDGDGVQDASELPLAGVDVTVTFHGPDGVLGGDDDEVHSVTTDGDGLYSVDNLPGGSYTVLVDDTTLPEGLAPSFNLDATLDHVWSGTLDEDEDKEDVDFGYTGTGTIGDTVWFDIDADGIVDGDEFGLEAVQIEITWLGFDGVAGGDDDVIYTATTDADGTYTVTDLPAGEYVVAIVTGTLPAGMSATYDNEGPADGTSRLTLAAGAADLDQDFGYAGSGSIGDFIWFDSDGDGAIDIGEPPLVGVDVQLTWPGEDGVLGGGDDEIFLTTTDAAGNYLFANLPPGAYQVDVIGALPTAAENTHDEDGNNDSSTLVNLPDGVDHLTADFGYQGTASIGDTVWWDINGDGSLDPGEPGIPGVEMTLVYAGLDGVLGNGDDITFTQVTDGNGNYLFTDLPEGNYSVTVSDDLPAGFTPTFDEDDGLDETSLVLGLGADGMHLSADFGYTGTGEIGDLVYLDSDNNGSDDPGEPGIPGVEVQLTWYGVDGDSGTADDVVLTTTTDSLGFYYFEDLPAGGYEVAVVTGTLPAGLSPTGDADGLVTPDVSTLMLGAGATDLDQDFGYTGGGSIGDTIWFDRNGDGVVDPDEYGLPDVEIVVIWAGPDGILDTGDDEAFITTTDADGNYLVDNLPPGQYRVWVQPADIPPGMAQTFDEDGTLNGATEFTLGDGADHLTADFGYNGSGSIGDLVWLDVDADGVFDPGEPGIPGQTVELTWGGPDGILGTSDDQAYTTVTDANGGYLFDGLPPGDYDVAVIGPVVGTAVNTADEDNDNDSHTQVSLGDGVSHPTADFGYAGTAEIGDLIWLDVDGDGVADAGEPGLAGVEVTVTWYGPDGVPGGGDDVTLPPVTTDADGNYLVTNLPEGEYGVAVTGGVPAGLVNSSDEDGDLDGQTDVSGLVGGTSHLTADFGFTGTGEIGDTIWWDLDASGAQEAGEPGIAGVDVTLTWAGLNGLLGDGDDIIYSTTTDAVGNYLFANLPPGDFTVVVDETDLPIGVTQSADPDGTRDGESAVTLGLAGSDLAQDFGYRGEGNVGDFIWYDLDDDGIQDANEPGVAGVEVVVTYFGADGVPGGGDDVVFVTTTDADGGYFVPGLPSGFYSAEVNPDTLPAGLSVSGDLDGGDVLVTLFTLGAAEDKTDVDYPVVGDASLGGTVWNDVDGDQLIGAGEPGIPGATVVVTWIGPDGPVEILVVTGPDGTWDLPQLPPGDYTVVLDESTVPEGMSPTTPIDGSVTLPVGGHEEIDFGLAEFVNVGSTVWIDTDGDGVVDPDEVGIPNVLVYLYDDQGNLVAVAETGANGNYRFTDLPPGTYLVQIDPDSLPDDVRATYDRDGTVDLTTTVTLVSGVDILDANFGFQVPDELPTTGFAVNHFLVAGGLLLLAGGGLVISTRIRRRTR